MLFLAVQHTLWKLPRRFAPSTWNTQLSIRQHTKSATSTSTTPHHHSQPDESLKKKCNSTVTSFQYASAVSPSSGIIKDSNNLIASAKKECISSTIINRDQNAWREYGQVEPSKLHKHYLKLSKIRLTSLVVITSMAGYALAPAPFHPGSFIMVSLGTGLTSCAANAINQFLEVPFDSQMSRTKNRVLVQGKLTPLHAVTFAVVSSSLGISLLYFGCNPLTATLGATNLLLYTMVYTPMKRISILNTWIGSVVGALPPLMGWAACSGELHPAAWIMAGLLYAWQFPHFNALSWNLRPDYSRAGYRMMSVTDPGLCKRTTLRYTIAILALSCGAPLVDLTNYWFALESLPLNAYFTYLAYQFYKKSDSSSSRKLFRFSLIHLPALLLLILINKHTWFIGKSDEQQSVKNVSVLNMPPVPILLGPKNVVAASSVEPCFTYPVSVMPSDSSDNEKALNINL